MSRMGTVNRVRRSPPAHHHELPLRDEEIINASLSLSLSVSLSLSLSISHSLTHSLSLTHYLSFSLWAVKNHFNDGQDQEENREALVTVGGTLDWPWEDVWDIFSSNDALGVMLPAIGVSDALLFLCEEQGKTRARSFSSA
jgi:hypothetical protein